MKIGILSMQEVVNYGSFMQAYGLKKLIKMATNEDATFITIIPGEKLPGVQVSKKEKLLNLLRLIKSGLLYERIRDKIYMKKLTKQFDTEFFPIFSEENNGEKFSTVVIGSDEVFHCTQNASWGFSTQLLGDVKNTENIISYAASFGETTIEKINKFKIKEEVTKNLKKISKISVRDNNSANIVENLLNYRPEIFLDPVLLSDYSSEISQSKGIDIYDKYIIVYSYTGRIVKKEEISAIKKFAEMKNLKIYTIFCRYKWADKTIIPDTPFQMLKYFNNAEYVVSDTFHGSIFSIITHKKFCTLLRSSNSEKMYSLLKMLGIEDRAISNPKKLIEILETDINYSKVDEIRNKERIRTINFMRDNIR